MKMQDLGKSTVDPRNGQDDDSEINLFDIASSLWGNRWRIVVVMLLALLVGVVAILLTKPTYRATGLIQLETDSPNMALPQAMQDIVGTSTGTGSSTTNTQIAIIQSRMVIGQAVRKLDLQIFAAPRRVPLIGQMLVQLHLPEPGIGALGPFSWGNESIKVGRLRVPPSWQNTPMTLTKTAPGKFSLELPDGRSVNGAVGTELTLPVPPGVEKAPEGETYSLMVTDLTGPVGRQFEIGEKSFETAVADVQSGFTVSQPSNQASILTTSYTSTSPELAEQVLNAVAQAYVEQNIERSASSAQKSLEFIRNQLPKARDAVDKAQNALNAYQQKNQSIDLTYQTQALLQRVTDLESKLSALALKEEEIKNLYTVNHPAYQSLLQDRKTLESQLADAKKAANGLPETQKAVFNLQRDLTVAQQIYVQLLNREQELRVVRASSIGSVRVIDTAYASPDPVAPQKKRILALALVAGFVIGSALVLLRRALRQGIRGAQEIEQLGLPVFATIPYASEVAGLRERKGLLPILALNHPDDVAVEALRSLRTSLHFGMIDATTNTVMVTSAAPAAGKSFTIINLAVVAAQAGQRVCVVDADLRRGYLRRFVGRGKDTPGLSEYLAKERSLEEVLLEGPVEGLSLILTGRYPPNPSEILMRSEFQDLLDELDKRFDLVLVDTAPTLAVTDPVVIGRYTGARILVARHMETMIPEVEAVRRAFENAGSKLTGAILNGYRISEASKYGQAYSYYNYRYSYKSRK